MFVEVSTKFADTITDMEARHRKDRKDWHEAMVKKEEADRQYQERRDATFAQSLDRLRESKG